MSGDSRPRDAAVGADEAATSIEVRARQEAEERAHDRVAPDATLDALAAVDLYVEAFLAGVAHARGHAGRSR